MHIQTAHPKRKCNRPPNGTAVVVIEAAGLAHAAEDRSLDKRVKL
jgi:hypothetical protein